MSEYSWMGQPDSPPAAQFAVVPAYNEAQTIGPVVRKTRRHVGRVIVVDDGSDDRTADIAQAEGAEIIRFEENSGKATALHAGFELVMEYGASVVVTLDADGEHDPRSIPDLMAPIESDEADVVVGSRQRQGDGILSAARRAGRKLLERATKQSHEPSNRDTYSGYLAFSTDALEQVYVALERAQGQDFESEIRQRDLESEIRQRCAHAGLTVSEVATQQGSC